MLVIHWSQARYGSLKIKGRKRPGINAMTYTSMEDWADYWCVHFIRQPVCSYSSLFIRAVDCVFFFTFSWIYQQIYLLLLPANVYIQWAVQWVLWAWSLWGLTDGFICYAWLQYLHLEMFFLDVGFYISVFVFLLLPFRCVLSRFYNCSLSN